MEAITTAFTTMAGDGVEVIGKIGAVGITVMGAKYLWVLGKSMFKSIAKG